MIEDDKLKHLDDKIRDYISELFGQDAAFVIMIAKENSERVEIGFTSNCNEKGVISLSKSLIERLKDNGNT